MSIFDPLTQPVDVVAHTGAVADAFGRFRVSNPETIFDSKQLHNSQPLYWDDQEESGTGTSTSHSTATASTTIAVGNTTAGKRARQTFQRFNYQPGKSQLVLLTGQMNSVGTGITAAMGLFDDEDGVFVQVDAGTLYMVIRSSASGTPVDNRIAQSSWNGDKLDGTGDSGYTLDPTKCQIFWMDMEWLGVGSVRCGFVINGEFIHCHTFHHANSVAAVYMSTPNLPLRYEIENDGTGAATSMQHICSTVISEGGSQALGFNQWASTGGTHVDCATENVIYAIIGVRLKSTHLDATVDVIGIETIELTGNKNWEWLLLLNPTVDNTFTYASLGTSSAVDYATGGSTNTVTTGTVLPLAGGFGASAGGRSGAVQINSVENALRIGSSISGTPDELVLCVRPINGSTNIDVEGGITLRQVS